MSGILYIFAEQNELIQHQETAIPGNMSTTRIIKVFLGSSITELKDERQEISSLADDISNLFGMDDIAVRFIKCDNLHLGNTGKPDQQEIDRKLKDCELSLFLFRTKAGTWTLHEFDVARALQNESKHTIFVYFLHVPEEEKEANLITFQQRLDNEGVFWKGCKSLSDVKFSFAMGILTYLGISLGSNNPKAQAIEDNGDARFEQFEETEKQQDSLREQLHQDIEDMLAQIDGILSDGSQLISARIIQVNEIYRKADHWASRTSYDEKKYYRLLGKYGEFLYKYGLYNDALEVWKREVNLSEKVYGTEHQDTATSYNNIGGVYYSQGDYAKALEYHQKALEIREKVLGTEHRDTATSYNNIGLVYDNLGDYAKALEYYQKALEIWEKVLGTDHPDTALSYNNIGLVFCNQGDYIKALEYYQKDLKICEKVLGTEHPDTALSYNNIGLVFCNQGDYAKALEYYQKALEIREKVLGTEHPNTATSYNNIGAVYDNQGDYTKALEYYQRALEIREKVLGTAHPDAAQSYNNIGLVYYNLGDYAKALEYHQKALKIREKVLGTEHPDAAQSYNNIGGVHDSQGDYTKALEFFQKASEIWEKVLGTEHPDTQIVRKNIKLCHSKSRTNLKSIQKWWRTLFEAVFKSAT